MQFVGIDLHQLSISLCVVDQAREVLSRQRFRCDCEEVIRQFFQELRSSRALIEATASYEWLFRLLDPLIGQPRRTESRVAPARWGVAAGVAGRVCTRVHCPTDRAAVPTIAAIRRIPRADASRDRPSSGPTAPGDDLVSSGSEEDPEFAAGVRNRADALRGHAHGKRAVRVGPDRDQHRDVSAALREIDVDVPKVAFQTLARIVH